MAHSLILTVTLLPTQSRDFEQKACKVIGHFFVVAGLTHSQVPILSWIIKKSRRKSHRNRDSGREMVTFFVLCWVEGIYLMSCPQYLEWVKGASAQNTYYERKAPFPLSELYDVSLVRGGWGIIPLPGIVSKPYLDTVYETAL